MGVRTWATYSALAPLTVVDTKKPSARQQNSVLNVPFRRKEDLSWRAIEPLIQELDTTLTPMSN